MNWEAIIRHYNLHHRPNSQVEFDWLRQQVSIREAIIIVARAKNESGLRHSHQCLIRREAIPKAEKLLLNNCNELQRSATFHELWTIINNILKPVFGIGP